MASMVQLHSPSLQQHGWGRSHDNQFTHSFSRAMGERLVSYSLLWKRSPSSPLVVTHFQSQAAAVHRKGVKFQAVTETLQHAQTSFEESSAGKLNVLLEAARTEEKLRAAATLRARSFYSYPEGRSRDALVAHQKMKSEDEWTTLTRKVGGMEPGYKRTTCVIALCPISDVLETSSDLLQSHCKIAASPAEDCVVVGTLDINQGLLLPGELSGDHPQGPHAEHCRAYLSNVCVAKEVRRQGVGMLLMQHVKKTAKLWGGYLFIFGRLPAVYGGSEGLESVISTYMSWLTTYQHDNFTKRQALSTRKKKRRKMPEAFVDHDGICYEHNSEDRKIAIFVPS